MRYSGPHQTRHTYLAEGAHVCSTISARANRPDRCLGTWCVPSQERTARTARKDEHEARLAEVRGLERRLAAAVESASRAETEAATCVEVSTFDNTQLSCKHVPSFFETIRGRRSTIISLSRDTCNAVPLFMYCSPRTQEAKKARQDVGDARAAQRHAELWLEKSFAEVDAVHALLTFEYTEEFPSECLERLAAKLPQSAQSKAATGSTAKRSACSSVAHSTAVENATQFPISPSPTSNSNYLETPELDTTVSTMFSNTRLPVREGASGWNGNDTVTPSNVRGRRSRTHGEKFSPPTPTVLFKEPASETRGDLPETKSYEIREPGISNGVPKGVLKHVNGVVELPSKNQKNISSDVSIGQAQDDLKTCEGSAPSPSSILLWHTFVLRYEMSRREKAEARASELEAEAEAAHKSEAVDSNGPRPSPARGENGEGVESGECRRCQYSSPVSNVNRDHCLDFVHLNRERQVKMIMGLVREARVKMGWSNWRSDNSVRIDSAREAWGSRWAQGSELRNGPAVERCVDIWHDIYFVPPPSRASCFAQILIQILYFCPGAREIWFLCRRYVLHSTLYLFAAPLPIFATHDASQALRVPG